MSGCFASIFMSCLGLTMFSSDAIQSGHINTSGIIFLTTNIKLKAKIVHQRQELSDPSHPLAYETERLPKRYLFISQGQAHFSASPCNILDQI